MADAMIRCDGLYKNDDRYLRFYPDGLALYVAYQASPEKAASLLVPQSNPDVVARGSYHLEGDLLKALLERCPPRGSYGYVTLSIEGPVEGDTLRLTAVVDEPGVADYGPPAGYTGEPPPRLDFAFVAVDLA